MAAADKLLYFDLKARGEPTRMIYALAGQHLEDKRISFGNDGEWPKLKSEQPLGQLPVFICSEGTLVMSNTIARYAAKKFNMAGETTWEEAINDMVVEACQETFANVGPKILKWKLAKVDPEPENSEAVLKEVYEGLLKTLAFIQKVAEGRGAAFISCDKICLADVWLYNSLEHAEHAYPEMMTVNPWVKQFVSKFTSDERVKKYLAERPKTFV